MRASSSRSSALENRSIIPSLSMQGRDWRRPTFAEFVERLEQEFGVAPTGSGLHLVGIGLDEPLAPEDIKALCAQLGVPPEDFGVEP